jgi:beta-aspartyl-peptidase (threonine type)
MANSAWALILHGGAATVQPHDYEIKRAALFEALSAGRLVLEQGLPATTAVEAAVRAMEDNATFNAGHGSVKNLDGEVELDAALMDGTTHEVGAVAVLRSVRHPISVATALLREKTVLLAGEGAYRFAKSIKAEPPKADTGVSSSSAGHDTVGCVALDLLGTIAVATSTGGLAGKLPGRVGDSPIVGCGFLAESTVGGIAFSGEGEAIMRTVLAAHAMNDIVPLGVQVAMERSVERVVLLDAEVGGIALNAAGEFGWAHNSTHFPVGMMRRYDEPRVYMSRGEPILK